MAQRIIVDPITRIEGHLRIEVEIDSSNVITDAWSSITLWRGIETILKGRDPRDAGLMVQRFCGVCTYSHYEASILACEDAFGVRPPANARLVRNLISECLHIIRPCPRVYSPAYICLFLKVYLRVACYACRKISR